MGGNRHVMIINLNLDTTCGHRSKEGRQMVRPCFCQLDFPLGNSGSQGKCPCFNAVRDHAVTARFQTADTMNGDCVCALSW